MSAEELEPSLYDIDFSDVDESSFDFFDDEVDDSSEPVASLDEITFDVLEPEDDTETNITAEAESIVEEMASLVVEQTIVMEPRVIEELVQIAEPDPISEPAKKVISVEALDLARKTVEIVLSQTERNIIPIGQLSDIAFDGQRISSREYREFLDALNEDTRLEYLGSGEYRVRLRGDTIEHCWQGERHEIDKELLTGLVESVFSTMSASSHAVFTLNQIRGIAKTQGVYLTNDEEHELLALLISDPRIRPLEKGDFAVRDLQDELPVIRKEKDPKPFDPGADLTLFNGKDGKPLSAKQIVRAVKNIDYSPEGRAAKDRAKRIANPHRGGRKQRSSIGQVGGVRGKAGYQGKNHGKKVSFDEMLAKLNNPDNKAKDKNS